MAAVVVALPSEGTADCSATGSVAGKSADPTRATVLSCGGELVGCAVAGVVEREFAGFEPKKVEMSRILRPRAKRALVKRVFRGGRWRARSSRRTLEVALPLSAFLWASWSLIRRAVCARVVRKMFGALPPPDAEATEKMRKRLGGCRRHARAQLGKNTATLGSVDAAPGCASGGRAAGAGSSTRTLPPCLHGSTKSCASFKKSMCDSPMGGVILVTLKTTFSVSLRSQNVVTFSAPFPPTTVSRRYFAKQRCHCLFLSYKKEQTA